MKVLSLILCLLYYRANKKSWMTGELFQEWLHQLDSAMRKKKRHTVLFLDNCNAHAAAVDKA